MPKRKSREFELRYNPKTLEIRLYDVQRRRLLSVEESAEISGQMDPDTMAGLLEAIADLRSDEAMAPLRALIAELRRSSSGPPKNS